MVRTGTLKKTLLQKVICAEPNRSPTSVLRILRP